MLVFYLQTYGIILPRSISPYERGWLQQDFGLSVKCDIFIEEVWAKQADSESLYSLVQYNCDYIDMSQKTERYAFPCS